MEHRETRSADDQERLCVALTRAGNEPNEDRRNIQTADALYALVHLEDMQAHARAYSERIRAATNTKHP